MYEIRLADGSPIYYQGDADYTAYNIECYTAKGDAGYVKFTLPKSNPAHGTLSTRSSIVQMLLDGESLGYYEVREITHGIEYDEQVYAVGELAWLYDSVQPQAEFHDVTPRGFLAALLNVHNAQCPDHQFSVGIVDVTDPNDSLYRFTNRETTLDDIRDKLVDRLGGQIKLRRANGVRYIDYLTDATYGTECTQRIYFGENLMDYSDTMTAADVCSAVVPLGCRLENDAGDNSTIGNLEKRLTIEDVNGGADWISRPQLVERFGNVRTVKIWDDVTVPQNLLSKAQKWLASDQFERMHLTVRAVDLSLTSTQFERFRCGDSAVVAAVPYGLERRFPITVRTYHPDSPESDAIELGDAVAVSYISTQNAINRTIATNEQESTYRQTQWLTEAIENVTAMMVGSRGGYKYTEYDDEGRWLADYILDADDMDMAQVVRKVNLNGTAYSTNGIQGPYETAIMANGTILGKYIQAHSVTAEKISQDYTSMWEDADTQTLNTARSEFKAADDAITARVSKVETDATGIRADLQAEMKVRADQIATTVKRGEINSTIKQTAETIYIESNKFGWNSSNSSMTTDGKLTARNATFTNCSVTGTITSTNGVIGGLTLSNSSLSSPDITYGTTGMHVCRNSRVIGHVGKNYWSTDTSKWGVELMATANGSFVCFGQQASVGDTGYTAAIVYATKYLSGGSSGDNCTANTVNFFVQTDFHNHKLNRAWIDTNTGGASGGVTGTYTFLLSGSQQITLRIKNGMIVG